jgi:hypothetical protein
MTTPGGKAVPYIASLRIRLNRSVQLKEGKKKEEGKRKEEGAAEGDDGGDGGKGAVYGIHTIAKVIKCRLGPPFRRCEFDITFSFGVDDEQSWFDFLHSRGEIEKANGWCYYTAFPSGKMSEKEDPNDKKKTIEYDRGLQFREKEWKRALAENQEFRKRVLDDLDRHLVVKYGERPADVDADPESLMDAESAEEMVASG